MSVAFDPYVNWLGIRDPQRPPNHYRLLGLDQFERDPDVIATAADRQMGHVRKFQQGQHSEASQRVLNELAAARLCLLNLDQKAGYDEQLRATLSAGNISSTIQIDERVATSNTGRKVSARGLSLTGLFSLILAILGLVSLLFVYRNLQSMAGRGGPQSPAKTAAEPARVDATVNPAAAEPPDNGAEGAPADGNMLTAQADPRDLLDAHDDQSDDDKSLAATSQPSPRSWTAMRPAAPRSRSVTQRRDPTLVAVREAMSGRDLARARSELALLHAKAGTLEQRERADRIELLSFQLERFWSSLRRALAENVTAGDQLSYKDATVTVKDVSQEKLSLELPDGTVKSFATDATAIDPDLAIALVRHQLPASSPTTDLVIGVFLAIDRQGDVPRARELLMDARTQGIPVDVLFPYWESRKLGEDTSSEASPVEDGSAPAGLPANTHGNRLAVPDAESQATALEKIRTSFSIDEEPASPVEMEQQSRLAADLFHQAINTHDSIATRYVLFCQALRLSLQSHNTELALISARRLAGEFDTDTWPQLLDEFTKLSRRARTAEQRARACHTGVGLIDAALSNEDYETALRLVALAQAAARKSRRAELSSLIDERREQVIYLRTQLKHVQKAREQLASDPSSPEANYAVGRYYCLARGEFDKGLSLLSKGGDPPLARLAKAELESSQKVDVRLDLADRWWDAADAEDKFTQVNLRIHAGEIYEQVLPQLSGAARRRAESRLAELAKSAAARDGQGDDIPDSLFTHLWRVEWQDKTIWQWAKFERDGNYTVFSFNKERRNRFQVEQGQLILDGKFLYTLRPEDQRLQLNKYDRQNGRLLSHGVGTVIGTRP